jgi:3-hydroxyacyl-[acyl-carrier-protein] dehydratase
MDAREHIISRLPYSYPFLFVDKLMHIDDNSVEGIYHLRPDLDFYKGHFKHQPITPGVILLEIMAQIGLVCLGLKLTNGIQEQSVFPFALSSSEIEFLKPVYPDETVTVYSEKIYFRFGKLKCKVSMQNAKGELVCEGTIAGILMKHHDNT